jgi:carboxypeptidase C (cathepsin A)
MSRLLTLAAAACAVALTSAAVPADKVTTIPGFGTPISDMYSGYLSANANKQAHYVFTNSLATPTTDPVVAWFNGGPGCSSMEGFLSESGLCE